MLSYIINKDDQPVPVKIIGDGSSTAINIGSFEVDSDGKQVLRVIDAAPYAYDPLNDATKITIVKSERVPDRLKTTVTIAASSNAYPYLNLDVAKYEKISWAVVADNAHAFKIRTLPYDLEDGVYLERTDSGTEPYLISTTKKQVMTKPIEIQSTGLYLQIINDDTNLSHTYTVYVYLR